MLKKTILFAIVLVALNNVNADAQIANFVGAWNQKERISLSGTDYANAIPEKVQLAIDNNVLSIERVNISEDSDKPNVIKEILKINGEKNINNISSARRKETSIKANGGMNFIEYSEVVDPTNNKLLFKISESWSLSTDAKKLTIVKNFESTTDPNDKWSMKGIYEKQ